MRRVVYNQQTARAVYIFGCLTWTDLLVIMAAFSLNMLTVEEFAFTVALFVGYPIYLISLRVGRNPGYDWHLFSSKVLPKAYRPGRRPFRFPITADTKQQ